MDEVVPPLRLLVSEARSAVTSKAPSALRPGWSRCRRPGRFALRRRWEQPTGPQPLPDPGSRRNSWPRPPDPGALGGWPGRRRPRAGRRAAATGAVPVAEAATSAYAPPERRQRRLRHHRAGGSFGGACPVLPRAVAAGSPSGGPDPPREAAQVSGVAGDRHMPSVSSTNGVGPWGDGGGAPPLPAGRRPGAAVQRCANLPRSSQRRRLAATQPQRRRSHHGQATASSQPSPLEQISVSSGAGRSGTIEASLGRVEHLGGAHRRPDDRHHRIVGSLACGALAGRRQVGAAMALHPPLPEAVDVAVVEPKTGSFGEEPGAMSPATHTWTRLCIHGPGRRCAGGGSVRSWKPSTLLRKLSVRCSRHSGAS